MPVEDYITNVTGAPAGQPGPAPGSNMVQGTSTPSPMGGRPSAAPGTTAPAVKPAKPEVTPFGFPQTPTPAPAAKPAKVTIDMGEAPKPVEVQPAKEPSLPPIPGVPDTSAYGDSYQDPSGTTRVRLNDEGKRLYAAAYQRALAAHGPWIKSTLPGAPTPVVRPGRRNYNALTNSWS